MEVFITLEEIISLSGKAYTAAEQDRIEELIPLVSDALRVEADRVGKDLDAMVTAKPAYASTVKMVVADIVMRVMRQAVEGDPMVQEAQSALGYSWSGTYAIPGGGISNAIMRNDLKRLGLRRQRYGVMEFYAGGGGPNEQQD